MSGESKKLECTLKNSRRAKKEKDKNKDKDNRPINIYVPTEITSREKKDKKDKKR